MISLVEVEYLIKKIERSSIRTCEVSSGSSKLILKAQVGGTSNEPLGKKTSKEHKATSPAVIKAPHAGVFYARHPLHPADSDDADTVATEVAGYLRIGSALSAVTKSSAVTLGNQLVPDGTRVGFGTPLYEIDE
ncbi:hypothetical protein [Herbaspirillum sp. 1130]|uniref:hypothetical protein n=1 Tax=Herbaspirillum sp. 1130 TaxID=2806562 RepID=UPI001AE39597|nr:hypothetical protein [Herbaspirillum sp. 1130]MBP1318300.1 acetyl-CoA carboxylase biotin carboxyl carrier protein [Herbaspirillum sp. 1130]